MNRQEWQQSNIDYLFAQIRRLKRQLHDHAERLRSSPSSANRISPRQGFDETDLPPADAVGDDAASQPALLFLAERFGLSSFEVNVLLFCVAAESDAEIANLCVRAHDSTEFPWPTFSLCLQLFEDASWNALLPDAPLRKHRLIDIAQNKGMPVLTSQLFADERVVNLVRGLNHFDHRLGAFIQPLDTYTAVLPASQAMVANEILLDLQSSAAVSGDVPVIQLVGSDSASKRQIVAAIADALARPLFRVPAELIPSDIVELNELKVLWERENALLSSALFVDASEADESLLKPGSPLMRFCSQVEALLFVDFAESQHGLRTATSIFDVERPTTEEQLQLWIEQLGTGQTHFAGQLAAQFDLDAGSIATIAQKTAMAEGRESFSDQPVSNQTGASPEKDSRPFFAQLWNACRGHCRPQLDRLSQRIDCRATFDDLVLPPEQLTQLENIVSQVSHRATVYQDWGFAERLNRGLGISVLFAGESGTGKTMAAEVLANELSMDLYRIDLSQIVNKYIGETEKNLKRVFDAAESGGCILFFDEADAIFGKRTEVKDSHDRHANIETNYLLQRMEAFRGLAILATNLKQSLDKAFLRRLRFVVDFPLPDSQQRREMWQRAFPVDTPLDDLDYDYLSRLNVTGGNIHTIALNAAFRSAREDVDVGMHSILQSAKAEYRKLQKPATAAEFQWAQRSGVPV